MCWTENEPSEATTDALCRAVPRPWFPKYASRSQDSLHSQATKPSRFRYPERLPPMSPTGLTPRLHAELNLRAATGTLALPPRAQLPTWVHARLLSRARLRHLPALRRGAWATCRPPTSAIVRSTSTPSTLPDPRRQSQQRAATRLGNATLAGDTSRAFPGQGLSNSRQQPPSRRPLAATDLPQPDRPGHLLSQARARLLLE